MIGHPRSARLIEYANRELAPTTRSRVADHLASCTKCRRRLSAIKRVKKVATQVYDREPPTNLLDRILERRAAGERVILPSNNPPPPHHGWWKRAAAATVPVSVIILVAIVGTRELGADFSELRFEPAQPVRGASISVEYRSTSMLAAEDSLVLRARYRTTADVAYNRAIGQFTVAYLFKKRGNVFTGTIRLPDSVVYAVFAVEDQDGNHVDSNGRALAELLTYNEGKPEYEALVQKQHDLMGRNWELASATARHAAELYAKKLEAWNRLLLFESALVGTTGADSLRATYGRRYEVLAGALIDSSKLTPGDAANLYWMGIQTGHETDADHWREVLTRLEPRHSIAIQLRIVDVLERHPLDDDRVLEALEQLWHEVGPNPFIVEQGYRTALQLTDPDAVVLWADRLVVLEPWTAMSTAKSLVQIPQLTHLGLSRLRRQLVELEDGFDATRELDRTRSEHRSLVNVQSAQLLAALGEALVGTGRTQAGRDTLALAAARVWNLDVFRALADVNLTLGDTSRAIQILANILADPSGHLDSPQWNSVLADTLRDPAGWSVLKQRASSEMVARTLARSVTRRLPSSVRLLDTEGSSTDLHAVADGEVTLVVFWSRYSSPARTQLPRLQELATQIQSQAMKLILVTGEPPSGTLDSFLEERAPGVPLFHDSEGSARLAFSSWGTPEYFILDAHGLLRFTRTSLKDALRQMTALQADADHFSAGA